MKQLTDILGQRNVRPPKRLVRRLSQGTGTLAACASHRSSEEGVRFARTRLHGNTDDLPQVIVRSAFNDIQRGIRRNERVEVSHLAVLPHIAASIEGGIRGSSHYLP